MNDAHTDFLRRLDHIGARALGVCVVVDDVLEVAGGQLFQDLVPQGRLRLVERCRLAGRDLRHAQQHPAERIFDGLRYAVRKKRESRRPAPGAEVGLGETAEIEIRSGDTALRGDVLEFGATIDFGARGLRRRFVGECYLLDVAVLGNDEGVFAQIISLADLRVGDLNLLRCVVEGDRRVCELPEFRRAEPASRALLRSW